MKKLALLLGALSLVSSVAYAKEVVPAVEEVVVVEEVKAVEAAPVLRVTSFGQGLEFDNNSGNAADIAEGMHFSNSVGLAYGDDWTFGLMARKTWSVDTDDHIHSTGAYRIDLDAWRNFGNYSLGARWRQEKDNDKYYLRAKYNYGMFSGDMDVAYQSMNGKEANDGWYFEGTPVAVTVGPVTAGYYLKSENNVAVGNGNDVDYWFRHQLRLSMPIYQGEKLNLGVQYGWEFANNLELADENATHSYKHDTDSHILWLNASYKVTENLTIDSYYEYDMFKWEKEGNGAKAVGDQKNDHSNKYYGEFFVGWTYTF